jgi:mono/diheme cytochrome c family protein
MKVQRTALLAIALGAAGLLTFDLLAASSKVCAAETQSFAEDILPLLKWRCAGCHEAGGEGYIKSGLDLTSYAGVMKGTKYGPVVIAGDPNASNLMWLLDWRAAPELRMPHNKKQLSSCDRDAVRTWIREGAKNN